MSTMDQDKFFDSLIVHVWLLKGRSIVQKRSRNFIKRRCCWTRLGMDYFKRIKRIFKVVLRIFSTCQIKKINPFSTTSHQNASNFTLCTQKRHQHAQVLKNDLIFNWTYHDVAGLWADEWDLIRGPLLWQSITTINIIQHPLLLIVFS